MKWFDLRFRRDGSAALVTPTLQMPAVAHALETAPTERIERFERDVEVLSFDDVYTAHVAYVW
ncbi:MAG: hypothetical protein AB7T06_42670, partial [Kofleriaceae bacterium]